METAVCTRCKRTREVRYLTTKTIRGKIKTRCRARSVCSSKARRLAPLV